MLVGVGGNVRSFIAGEVFAADVLGIFGIDVVRDFLSKNGACFVQIAPEFLLVSFADAAGGVDDQFIVAFDAGGENGFDLLKDVF
ncbi:MAG: hypothetical protein WDA02_03980 [Saccharofermentanales bacterium]